MALAREEPPAPSVLVQTIRGKNFYLCSGALISPDQVLSTAHCLDHADKIRISTDPRLTPSTRWVDAATWKTHPSYTGNNFNGYDLGSITLKDRVQFRIFFSPTARVPAQIQSRILKRSGFGFRNGGNSRAEFVESGEKLEFAPHYVQCRDDSAVLGDSGAPVFFRQGRRLLLIGLHTGRKQNESGQLENYSNTVLLTLETIDWIKKKAAR